MQGVAATTPAAATLTISAILQLLRCLLQAVTVRCCAPVHAFLVCHFGEVDRGVEGYDSCRVLPYQYFVAVV